MLFIKNVCCVFLLIILNGIILYAQPLEYSAKRELLNKQLIKLSDIQDSIFGSKKDFINGKLFYPGGNKFIHPFFIDNYWKSAKVFLPGKVYELEMVKYDICMDYLVHLHNFDSYSNPIYLNKEFVKEFIINDHHFKYINDFEKSVINDLKPGYYEVLYDGLTKFYLRWVKVKKINVAVEDEGYSERNYFFLKKDGKYIRIIGQKGLINALSDHKTEIRMYMKKNKLRFTLNNYGFLGKMFEYYDNL